MYGVGLRNGGEEGWIESACKMEERREGWTESACEMEERREGDLRNEGEGALLK